MEIKDVLLGVMAFVLFTTVAFALVGRLYASDNLDVDLSADNVTSPLLSLQEKAEESQTELETYNRDLQDKTMTNVSLDSEVTTADLVGSAWGAFTNIPSYIGVFFNMIGAVFNSFIGFKGFLWFFVGIIVISIAIAVINAVLGSRL
jgi:hypothetical protein